MTQFKVGDKVVRFRDPWGSGNIGVVGVVTDVLSSTEIRVKYSEGITGSSYESCNFNLFEPKSQPHKHAEAIKAWADGAKIEVKDGNKWHESATPLWLENREYRVKPTPKPDTFRYIAVNDDYGVRRFTNLKDAQLHIGHQTERFTILKLTYDGETGKVKAREIIQ